mmetsp:Transcript_30224/g.97219  ORF Transcript_30224/g.97219 Transcript_30224/m.97219 type:complete len:237 (+) Transcript_30224:729-1439(+)
MHKLPHKIIRDSQLPIRLHGSNGVLHLDFLVHIDAGLLLVFAVVSDPSHIAAKHQTQHFIGIPSSFDHCELKPVTEKFRLLSFIFFLIDHSILVNHLKVMDGVDKPHIILRQCWHRQLLPVIRYGGEIILSRHVGPSCLHHDRSSHPRDVLGNLCVNSRSDSHQERRHEMCPQLLLLWKRESMLACYGLYCPFHSCSRLHVQILNDRPFESPDDGFKHSVVPGVQALGPLESFTQV